MRQIKRARKRERVKKKLISIVVLCLLSVILFSTAAASEKSGLAVISMKAKSETMYQDSELPKFSVDIHGEGAMKTTLDEKEQYTAQQFMESLTEGKDYTLECESDGTKEGTFPVKIKLSDDLQKKLEGELSQSIFFETRDGTLTVKNKYGEWDGKKFKQPDGTYVQNGWVEDDGEKYYFDGEGNLVTGELRIGVKTYQFAKDGKLKSEESSIDPNKPMLALTFDDGPGKRTGELLDQLEKYNSRATFFMLGQNAQNNGELIKRMAKQGCELSNHSMTHANLSTMDPAGILDEVDGTNKIINGFVANGTTTLRPPYGAVSDTLKQTVKMPFILWSVDTLDWQTKNAKATVDSVLNTVRDGDIVLMHDIHSTTIDATLELIPKLVEQGYQLVTVSELAEARGVVLENGHQYYSFPPGAAESGEAKVQPQEEVFEGEYHHEEVNEQQQ